MYGSSPVWQTAGGRQVGRDTENGVRYIMLCVYKDYKAMSFGN